jgi:hypothetical protein
MFPDGETMDRGHERFPWFWVVVAALIGVAVEGLLAHAAHRRESWDSPYYFRYGLPALVLAALVCGLFARRARLAIGYAPFFGQLLAMVVRMGAGSMLPLGVVMTAIVGLSGVLAASVGIGLGRRVL